MKNPQLFKTFDLNATLEDPKLYIIINSHDSEDKKFIDLETFVGNMSRNGQVHNTGLIAFWAGLCFRANQKLKFSRFVFCLI